MKKHVFLTFCSLLSLLITGCDTKESSKNANQNAHVTAMASLPLIQNTILSLSPTFGGTGNDIIMEQVCALAEGSKTPAQFNGFFSQKGIDLNKFASQDDGFALLADPSLAKAQTACIAYNFSSVFIYPSVRDFADANAEGSDNVDQVKLAQLFNRKLQLVVTNAKFFYLIAERIERSSAATVAQHKKEIIR